ncbi:MAG: 3-oxoacyl-ACP synthase [Gammaproteobacteria bacterium]|nr:3-oxoacyl-ACP synthase [Gammaproteobacteria bacterium]
MTPFKQTYLIDTAAFLPGEPIDNAGMDQYIGSINRMSGRIKQRILAENGIKTRHYALDSEGNSLHSVTSMGAEVVRSLIADGTPVDFLAAATTGGDCAAPGLANLIQGELHLPPLEALSISGICAASIGALNAAAQAVESGAATRALALASEFPSRLFKASRFQNRAADIDFDAHFLRWMLSDGAGGVALSNRPASTGHSLKIRWIHQKSFSGDLPTCMQAGLSPGNRSPGYLDFPNLDAAERAGAFDLRQDIRLLPNLFDLGLHEYAQLVKAGHLDPTRITWFLCHYSSERFKPMMEKLMDEAGLAIPPERWFSNLASKGNTGAASIFIMLDEFYQQHADTLTPGDQIFGFIPESGQFAVAYFLLEVVDAECASEPADLGSDLDQLAPPPIRPDATMSPPIASMLKDLMEVWHGYRSDVFRSELVRAILDGTVQHDAYLAWMENWIPQVREGSLWMRRAVSSMSPGLNGLAQLVQTHADEEQLDWQMLYRDYRNAGGVLPRHALRLNPGGEALNAFMHAYASRSDPVGLLGGIYIIEGTGQRIVPTLLPRLKSQLGLSSSLLQFMAYHGENDQSHMLRWLEAVKLAAAYSPAATRQIVEVARSVALLYLQQWQYLQPQDPAS